MDIGDKPETFVGSKTWIGSQELFLAMGHLYKVVEIESMGELRRGGGGVCL